LRVKICGITNRDDLEMVARAGADYFGVIVEIPYSPRNLSREDAAALLAKPPILGVAVVQDIPLDRLLTMADRLHPFALQLVGEESPEMVGRLYRRLDCSLWKTVHLPPTGTQGVGEEAILDLMLSYQQAGAEAILVDTALVVDGKRLAGGTGRTSDWSLASRLLASLPGITFLSGGLTPENVAAAIRQVNPGGVDVSGGVEAVKGKKDPLKVSRFMEAVRPFDDHLR